MDTGSLFLSLGVMFVIGLVADLVGRQTRIPRVTLLLLCGLAAGQAGWIPAPISGAYEFLSVVALTFVAFLLGHSLELKSLQATGRRILAISIAIVAVTIAVVSLGLMALGTDPPLAIVLAGIATATAPAATTDVIRQSGYDNDFTRTLEGVVAVDDAWGLIAFSVCISLVTLENGTSVEMALVPVVHEIGGALLLGVAIGLPGAAITGRIRRGEPLEIEALALVFLTAGAAIWADVSFLIAGMAAGSTIVNIASHHDRAFHEIEHIQWPFMVLFFLLAGATLEISALTSVGALGLAYLSLRTIARLVGGRLGAQLGGAQVNERNYYGIALLPQAGVAVGMSLIAARALPEYADRIITLTIGSTIIFELVGPILTHWAIRRVSEER